MSVFLTPDIEPFALAEEVSETDRGQRFDGVLRFDPDLVVVVESTQSEDDMRALFRQEVKPRLGDRVGKYNQEI